MATPLRPLLVQSVVDGDFKKVQDILNSGGNVNVRDEEGDTALYWAVIKGETKIAEYLIMRGNVDVNLTNLEGNSPLMRAAYRNDSYLTTLLINNKADVFAKDKYGNTALHYAMYKGDLKTIQALLEAQAHIYIKNEKGKLPIDLAPVGSRAEIEKFLVDFKSSKKSRP